MLGAEFVIDDNGSPTGCPARQFNLQSKAKTSLPAPREDDSAMPGGHNNIAGLKSGDA
jgi:hypothetical protein